MSLMTEKENDCIHKYMSMSKTYLEWGAGESTRYASRLSNLQRIFSVESSNEFFQEHVLSDPEVARASQEGRLEYRIANLGPCKTWGIPVSQEYQFLWPNYVLCPFLDRDSRYDMVLIDGRFRVACALASCLAGEAVQHILIHDYAPRPEYHVVEEFADVVERVDTLVVLKRKPNASRCKLQRLLSMYIYMPTDVATPPTFKNKLVFKARRLLSL